MFSKNTIIDLWQELEDIPVIINSENTTVIDAPDGFMGWPQGTDVEEIWTWFDDKYKDYGGVYALMYGNPKQNRCGK